MNDYEYCVQKLRKSLKFLDYGVKTIKIKYLFHLSNWIVGAIVSCVTISSNDKISREKPQL